MSEFPLFDSAAAMRKIDAENRFHRLEIGATEATGKNVYNEFVAPVASVAPDQASRYLLNVAFVALVALHQDIQTALNEIFRSDFDRWIEIEERAAILEYDGGYSRVQAEVLAWAELGLRRTGDD